MEAYLQFIICIAVIVGAIIIVKIFNTVWYCVEKKFAPDRVTKPSDTPEAVFKNLRNKTVVVYLKNGEIIEGYTYNKTIFFNQGDFAMNTTVYFELEKEKGNVLFISGLDISKIEAHTKKS
jgi:hypothetical protein